MRKLNFPEFTHKLKETADGAYIFDPVRKDYISLTPEEWVRQNVLKYLVEVARYPMGLMSIERGLKYHKLNKRYDLMVRKRDGSPYLLVECKSYHEKLNQKTVIQASLYNDSLEAEYILITNGLIHYVFQKKPGPVKWEQVNELPSFPEL